MEQIEGSNQHEGYEDDEFDVENDIRASDEYPHRSNSKAPV
jgi:hypothetical protein